MLTPVQIGELVAVEKLNPTEHKSQTRSDDNVGPDSTYCPAKQVLVTIVQLGVFVVFEKLKPAEQETQTRS